MDPYSPTGVLGLQSGFVLAAILLAVFLAERLGGSSQVALRGFQVALGLALVFVVISGTSAFDRPPETPEELQGALFEEDPFTDEEEAFLAFQDTAQGTARNTGEVRTIHAGLGMILIVSGLALLARLQVIPLGVMLGGLLLLLFGSPSQQGGLSGFMDYFSAIFGTLMPGTSGGGAGQARDIAYFAVLLLGTAALVAFGFWRWERSAPAAQPAAAA